MDGLSGPALKFSHSSVSRWQYFQIPRRSREEAQMVIEVAGTHHTFQIPRASGHKASIGLPVSCYFFRALSSYSSPRAAFLPLF